MIDVSVIIAAGRADANATVESIRASAGNSAVEIIVVGDDKVARPDGDIVWIKCATTNPATKRNIGAAAANGRYLAFIDDDAVAAIDWLAKIVDALDGDSTIAGIGGPNLAPDGMTDDEKLTDAVLGSRIGSGSKSYAGGGPTRDAGVGEIHLVNFAVGREFFFKVGGFNERLGYGGEDSEFVYLAQRLQSARFVFLPELKVYHKRRPFGLPLIEQRFKLRSQNGRLLWTRPGMYISNRFFLVSILATYFGAPLAVMCPSIIPVAIIAYAVALAVASTRVSGVGRLRWIAATAAVHAVSVVGIFYGFLKLPTASDYAGLARRPK